MWRPTWGGGGEKPTTPAPEPELSEEELIERTAKAVVERGLAAPAVFFLESSKPLSFVASQGMLFLGPFVDAAFSAPNYDAFCRMLENRQNVEKLLQRIEELEDERLDQASREKAAQRRAKEEKKHGSPGA